MAWRIVFGAVMPKASPTLVAETKRLSDLVRLVMSGRIRVPVYQRELQWDASDVLALFDSIYRGFPIGSLVFHKRPAPAKTVDFGPLVVHAPEQAAALDVVDGQQRLVALTASLMRPLPIPTTPEDPYVVYFDLQSKAFRSPPPGGDVPDGWVPLPYMSDVSSISEWAHDWAHGQDASLRRTLVDAGARIRQYQVPVYVVEVEEGDSELPGEIFHRINASGKPLEWPVIYNGLYGNREREAQPSTLEELAEALVPLGMGRLDTHDLLRCLIAHEGRHQTPDLLAESAARALPTMRRVLGFLRTHAHIEHERLLPRTAPLPILTRFFRVHPEPNSRSLELLTRWLWRSALAQFDETSFQRQGVREIDDDEESSVQRLLALLPSFLPPRDPGPPTVPQNFDARAAESRIALLGLASLGPRDLSTRRPLDIAALIESSSQWQPRRILGREDGGGELLSSPANRIILPGAGPARTQLLEYIEADRSGCSGSSGSPVHPTSHDVLGSHAISARGRDALTSGDLAGFLVERERVLNDALRSIAARFAAWTRMDRPSIDHILDCAK
jgi:hypothetical protein